jgi:hypothetical protein
MFRLLRTELVVASYTLLLSILISISCLHGADIASGLPNGAPRPGLFAALT